MVGPCIVCVCFLSAECDLWENVYVCFDPPLFLECIESVRFQHNKSVMAV